MTTAEDVITACADLVGRTGAKAFEIGYLHDDVPIEEAAWYATAVLKGAKVIEQDHASPEAAAAALAQRILIGAKCKCGKLVALDDHVAFAFTEVEMADGSTWTATEAARAGLCRWRRVGPRWERGCEATNRASRRARRARR